MNADRERESSGRPGSPGRDGRIGRSRSDGGYVRRPGADDGERTGNRVSETSGGRSTDTDETRAEGFGSRGWVLVGVVAVSLLVIPGVIYLRPMELANAGLPFLVAMLVLPMVPAVLLGLTALWSMTTATGEKRASE